MGVLDSIFTPSQKPIMICTFRGRGIPLDDVIRIWPTLWRHHMSWSKCQQCSKYQIHMFHIYRDIEESLFSDLFWTWRHRDVISDVRIIFVVDSCLVRQVLSACQIWSHLTNFWQRRQRRSTFDVNYDVITLSVLDHFQLGLRKDQVQQYVIGLVLMCWAVSEE